MLNEVCQRVTTCPDPGQVATTPGVSCNTYMLLAHIRYLSGLTTYFLIVGIFYCIGITYYLLCNLLGSPMGYKPRRSTKAFNMTMFVTLWHV